MGSSTPRLAIPYPVGSDTNNVPADFQRLATTLDSIAVSYQEGTAATRPTAGEHGRLYYATDTHAVYYDYGTDWTQLNLDAALGAITAKGDLIVGTGAGQLTNLEVGANGQTLQAASGTPSGLAWGNVAGAPVGLPGAVAAARFVGGTTSGAPITGTFAAGDFVIDQTGELWICYQAGEPGSWRPAHTPALGQPAVTPGAGAATRFVGGTSSGPPSQGTFFVGDFVIDQTAAVWVCIAGGSPGTWVGLVKNACFTAFQSVTQEILAEIWQDLRFDTVAIDTDEGHDPDAGMHYTCRRRGTYRITGSVAFDGFTVTSGGVGCRLTFNGDPIVGTALFIPVISLGFNCPSAHPAQIELDIGDIVAVQGWHPASSSQFTSVSQPDVRCRFSVEQIR